MKHVAFAGIAFLLLTILCCRQKTAMTPEKVVVQWQAHIDKNQFEAARLLSTGEALEYIAELASYNGTDTLEWENNIMLNLHCKITGDSAHCTYNFEDELGNPLPGQLALKRIKGQWLVNRTYFDDLIPVDSLDSGEEMLFPGDTLDEVLE